MKRIRRDKLTPAEAARYAVRQQVEQELPELIERHHQRIRHLSLPAGAQSIPSCPGCVEHLKQLERKQGHIKDCELGINWKSCPACVESFNQTCLPREVLPIPVPNSYGLDDQ
jgi:hypothetical protein